MPARQGPHAGKGPRGWTRSDDRLWEEVSDRLHKDHLLDAREIDVRVHDGVVTLTGEAPGASDAAHAEMLARETPGVVQVVNRLTFHPGPRAVDRSQAKPEDPPSGPWGRWKPPVIT